MAHPSTFVVAIEFVAGVWTNVSAYVDWQEPTTIKRGRNSVLDTAQPGTCSLTLFNNDGRFTPTSSSPYYPNVRPNVRIRVTVNSSIRFTGYVDDWIPAYPSDSQDEVRVQVNATDRMRLLARHKVLDSTYVENFRVLHPDASIWLWDGVGTSCPDIMGNEDPTTLVTYKASQYGNSVGTISYGASGPERVSSGVQLTPGTAINAPGHDGYLDTDDSSGSVIHMPTSLDFTLAGTSEWTLGFWTKIDAMYDRNNSSGITMRYGTTLAGCDGGSEWTVWLESSDGRDVWVKMADNSGNFFATSTYMYTMTNPSVWHYWTITWDGSLLRTYLDGILVVSGNPAAPRSYWTSVSLMGYTFPVLGVSGSGFGPGRVWNHPNASVAGVVYVPEAISAGHVLSAYATSLTGFTGETTAARAARYFAVAGVDVGDYLADNGPSANWGSAQATHGPFDTAGKDVLALGQEIAQAERGLFFVSGDGTVRMADRYARGMSSTPDATFEQEADTSGTDYAAPLRDAQIVNRVTVTTTNGGSATANDSDSQTLNGIMTSTLSLGLDDSAQGADYASWVVSQFATPKPRIAQITLDMLTSGTAGIYASAFALELGSRIQVTGLPAGSVSTIFEGFVEGFAEVYSANEVTMTLDTSPVLPGEIVLDDDVLGRFTTNDESIAGMTAVATTVLVSANPGFYWTGADLPYDVQVGSEQMTVTSATAPAAGVQTLTVTRGVNGTTAAAHDYGEAIVIVGDIVLGY